MPKYVVVSNHPPNACPSANANVRKRNETLQADLATLGAKYKIKFDVIYHLDPGHKVLLVLEAPSAESVRDMIYEGGLQQYNDFEFYMASTLEALFEKVLSKDTLF